MFIEDEQVFCWGQYGYTQRTPWITALASGNMEK